MLNQELVAIFYEIADLLEIKNEKWKANAFRIAAKTIEAMKENIENIYLVRGIIGLMELPGIGKGIAKKIVQYIETGKIKEHEKLKKSIPKPVYEMMNIPNIGAKKALLFYNSGIRSISELEQKAKKHKLAGLPLIKEKTEQKILEGIKLSREKKERMPLEKAEKLANMIINELKKLKQLMRVEAAGSIRRKQETIGDIDLVIEIKNNKEAELISNKFVKMPFAKEILNKGKEKATILTKNKIQIDIRFFTKEEYGAGLLYFTGNKQHNIFLRKLAIKQSMKLNEYGLFKGKKRIAGKTEDEIYEKLGLNYIEPEMRYGEIALPA